MAHQPEIIPWHKLAAHLQPCLGPKPDLKYRGDANQEADMEEFTNSFTKAIQEAAHHERAKYPPKYESPGDEEVVLSHEVARKITPSVRMWRGEVYTNRDEKALRRTEVEDKPAQKEEKSEAIRENNKTPHKPDFANQETGHSSDKLKGGFKWDALCEHKTDNLGFKCGCALPFQERTAKAFTRKRINRQCNNFVEANAHEIFNLEVTKTLIMLGDLEPVLRICARSDHNISDWHSVDTCYCCDEIEGWIMLYEAAFHSYLILNTFYCFPNLWQRSSDKQEASHSEDDIELNYRSTGSYSHMVGACNGRDTAWMCNYVHREFYQLAHFEDDSDEEEIAIRQGGNLFRRFVVSANLADDVVDAVQDVCQRFRVPEELCLSILEYTLIPKTPVPQDPLHPNHRDKLVKYLDECWMVMVRCQVVGMEVGIKLNWKRLLYWGSILWRR